MGAANGCRKGHGNQNTWRCTIHLTPQPTAASGNYLPEVAGRNFGTFTSRYQSIKVNQGIHTAMAAPLHCGQNRSASENKFWKLTFSYHQLVRKMSSPQYHRNYLAKTLLVCISTASNMVVLSGVVIGTECVIFVP